MSIKNKGQVIDEKTHCIKYQYLFLPQSVGHKGSISAQDGKTHPIVI